MRDKLEQDVRVAIMGAPGVGKSAISVRFLTKRFIGEYESGIESIYRKEAAFEDDVISYELKDSSGRLCAANPRSYFSWASTVAVVYSIVDRSSFISAAVILEEARRMSRNPPPGSGTLPSFAIFANKCDLCHRREVSTEEGRSLALRYGAVFYEVSAAEDYDNVFLPLNTLIIQSHINATKAAMPKHRSSSYHSANLHLPLIEENVLMNKQVATKKSPTERKQSVRRKLSAAIFKKRSETV